MSVRLLVGVELAQVVVCWNLLGGTCPSKYFTFYGNDAPNQHTWSNLGTAGLPDIIGTPTLAHPPPRRLCLRALVC